MLIRAGESCYECVSLTGQTRTGVEETANSVRARGRRVDKNLPGLALYGNQVFELLG